MSNFELSSFRFKTDRGKTFFFDVKSNRNGRFLRITESRPKAGEEDSYIRNFMTVPEEHLPEFMENLKDVRDFLENTEAEYGR